MYMPLSKGNKLCKRFQLNALIYANSPEKTEKITQVCGDGPGGEI